MLTALRLFVAAVAVAMLPVAAVAQSITLTRPSLSPLSPSVTVTLGGTARPDAATASTQGLWAIVARSPENPVGARLDVASASATTDYATTGLMRITLADPLTNDVTEVDVIFLLGSPIRTTWKARKQGSGLGIFAVDKKEKSDVYLSGSWVASVDAAPLYNLEIAVAAPVRDFALLGEQWRFKANLSARTADRRSLDPDAYAVSAQMGLIFPGDVGDAGPYVDVQWDVTRLEFSRKDEAKNIVTSPVVTLSKNLLRVLRPDRRVKAAMDLDLSAGIDLGANLQNKIVVDGYGLIARFVPGVSIAAVFPNGLGFDEVKWTSTYRARILATAEPFIDVRNDDAPLTSIAKGTRHEWKDELVLRVSPLIGLVLSHDYGSVPPAFKIIDHRGTVGIAVMWAWRK